MLGKTTNLTEIEGDQATDNSQEISGGITGAIVCQDQVLGQVPTETESGVSDTGNMITLLWIVQI